ncbi:bifunctional diaminohydroxyphosphoribosylaminopyrimidine deaminase/5-amino-6-(5-phosphoribosylamino)uracil reductase RibD [Arenicella xantha]|uniref:Riboflavin biosynthesis protein RibD n=1 Tax=Arenicella xantha TaxID=644221 RepID=A0A395JLR0_9GAMM|nr:bifunctional diaminohydroxyphosphoribosylaminopyrimidine deaminase/5-amino-6-(5-phosphoribosylamino)uracil reductase RibD [Arenicella xantha]RBP50787.1 diaminohydroxyphosphoribosylaminopyrimidine deaminase [Arenicella xantha]
MNSNLNDNLSDFDTSIMQRVLELASQGTSTTQPNPRVACIIVNGKEIVGEGVHHMAGEPHAERLAIEQAGELARGGTAFVNLEPCCHQGRTPPCTDGLVDAGISRVVAAMRDPNPLVEGGGFELLTDAGIDVEYGLLENEARWLNRGFVSRMVRGRPWVALKTGATLDGRTAAYDGESKWITSPEARIAVQELRANSSAVVTGIGTVMADDPNMNVRIDGAERQPYRVVLDSHLQLPIDAQIIGTDQKLIVFTLSQDLDRVSALTEAGVEVVQLNDTSSGRINLHDVMAELSNWQCNEVLLEAGQTLSGAFMEAGLIDELTVFYAGSVLGDKAQSMFQFESPLSFAERFDFHIRSAEMVGPDVCLTAINQASWQTLVTKD